MMNSEIVVYRFYVFIFEAMVEDCAAIVNGFAELKIKFGVRDHPIRNVT
jgi:hypothetical protein